MADATPFTDPHLRSYLPVPPAGPGVCPVCHSGPAPGHRLCHSCEMTTGQVSHPATAVVPVSLYETPSDLWRVLREYKDGDRPSRAAASLQVAAILARFTARHWACLAAAAGGPAGLITCVPSTRPDRCGRHPLERAVSAVTHLATGYTRLLAPGPADTDHNQADDDAFAVTGTVLGQRVLLIDDTFTTGARAQSAASALRRAGAAAVVVLVVGRVIWPDWNENCRRIWDAARASQFTFATCCHCRR